MEGVEKKHINVAYSKYSGKEETLLEITNNNKARENKFSDSCSHPPCSQTLLDLNNMFHHICLYKFVNDKVLYLFLTTSADGAGLAYIYRTYLKTKAKTVHML